MLGLWVQKYFLIFFSCESEMLNLWGQVCDLLWGLRKVCGCRTGATHGVTHRDLRSSLRLSLQ